MKENEKIQHIRHTLAHLLAAAVLELWPDTKRAIGPAIENGFYYDMEFSIDIQESHLSKIEAKMRELLPSWQSMEQVFYSKQIALDKYKDNPYKIELIEEFSPKGESLSFYKADSFEDLCKGGHVNEPARDINPEAFKLTHLAGAYWRGSEKNKMLTRIYGVAFETREQLNEHLKMLEEAKKRDHKKLGKELDLYVSSDLVGSGLPLWTPKGTILRDLLADFVWDLRRVRGYHKVEIPHITKKELYETSGHWDKFKNELFRIKTREGHQFAMKPMNCPHHTQIYDRKQHSYRDLPQRYASTTMCYRDEQSGELNGLLRVRAFTQDDAHIFCRYSQVKQEADSVWDIVYEFYESMGFEPRVRLSLHDPENMQAYLGDESSWIDAEQQLREMIQSRDVDFVEAKGDAAFYGPKIDFVANDSIGREFQIATIQLDMNMPKRFGLTFINEKGEKEEVAMLHAAIMGSIERFLAILIEHLAGAFPVWLSPVQLAVLPISERHNVAAQKIIDQVEDENIRAELYDQNESIGKKIREAEMQKIPYLVIIGDKEIEAQKIAVRQRGKGDIGQVAIDEFIRQLKQEIETKTL